MLQGYDPGILDEENSESTGEKSSVHYVIAFYHGSGGAMGLPVVKGEVGKFQPRQHTHIGPMLAKDRHHRQQIINIQSLPNVSNDDLIIVQTLGQCWHNVDIRWLDSDVPQTLGQ